MVERVEGYFPEPVRARTEVRVGPSQTLKVEGRVPLLPNGRLPKSHPLGGFNHVRPPRHVGSMVR
jgi:hypothetical protein